MSIVRNWASSLSLTNRFRNAKSLFSSSFVKEKIMKKKITIVIGAFLFLFCVLATPTIVNAEEANATLKVVKENPGKSAGIAGCGVVVAFFPPAAIWCAVSVSAGAIVDEVEY